MANNRRPIQKIQFPNEILLPMVVSDLEKGKTVTINLRGYSMRPFLENDRDKALLTLAKDPQVGDAVLAEISPKKYVLHALGCIQHSTETSRILQTTYFRRYAQHTQVYLTSTIF
jgi:hypothetical protein